MKPSACSRAFHLLQRSAAGLILLVTTTSFWPQEATAEVKPYTVSFPAHEARFVRVLIQSTNRSEPCIDEFEVYGPDDVANVALATRGAKATASSCLPGHAIHRIEHLNDGQYGNGHSWIAATDRGEWAQSNYLNRQRFRR